MAPKAMMPRTIRTHRLRYRELSDQTATLMLVMAEIVVGWANDPSSATRPTGGVDCNLDAMAGFAAAHVR